MARSGTLCLAVLLAAFELGSCLRCYQCNSQSSPECKDSLNGNKFLTDCSTQDSVNFNRQYVMPVFPGFQDGLPGASRYCHKIQLQSGTVIRTCLDANPADLNHTCRLLDSVTKNSPGNAQMSNCNVCDKEQCNAAATIPVSLPLAAVSALVAYLAYKQ